MWASSAAKTPRRLVAAREADAEAEAARAAVRRFALAVGSLAISLGGFAVAA